ncbi:MAG: glycosyl hydrolase family 18 protein [Verrucomicrobiota bacterium]
MNVICRLLAFLLLATAANAEKLVVAYVPNWIDLEQFSKTIGYSKLTHINIAFENPEDAGGKLSFNPQNTALITRARAKNVKILVSIGGGSASSDEEMRTRYFNLLEDGKRAAFVNKIAAYITLHKFDGVDVDLEGPAINENYGKFIRELSKALKPEGKLLSAALSQGYGGNKVPESVFKHFDFLNIMAYDATGNWDPDNPGQHSSLAFAKSNVTYWLNRGLPKSKAVLGVPFYGYGFGEAYANEGYSYQKIVATYPGAENLDQVGNTIWYNGIPTIEAKTRYVIDRNLAGVMIWSLDNDAKGPKSLLNAIDRTLR